MSLVEDTEGEGRPRIELETLGVLVREDSAEEVARRFAFWRVWASIIGPLELMIGGSVLAV